MSVINPFLNVSWDDVRLFLAALEHGSFTVAARETGVGQATMSRRIAALEQGVGHALFDRSRSGLSPTDAAQRLRPWAEAMGASMRDAGAALAGLEAAPEGRVRLTCAPDVAVDFGPRLVRRLAVAYPKLLLELLADTRVRDLTAHEADLALRNGQPERGPLLVKKVAEFSIGLFGSRAFVKRLPAKVRLEQVPLIDCSEELPALARQLARLPCPRALVTNDFLVMCAAAAAGVGAMVTTSVQARLRGLVPIEVAFPGPPAAPMFLVTHQALRRVPRVAVVFEAIEALMRELT